MIAAPIKFEKIKGVYMKDFELKDLISEEGVKLAKQEDSLLGKQIRALDKIEADIYDMFATDPRNGHGGTPNIVDNSKGRRMIRVCERRNERIVRLYEKKKEQIEKIQRTLRRDSYRYTQTRKSEKFISKNEISPVLFEMEKDGICRQWRRNPQFFFMKDFDKVAIFTLNGKVGVNAKYKAKTQDDFNKIKEIIEQYQK